MALNRTCTIAAANEDVSFFRQKNDFSNEMTILTFNVIKQKNDLLDFNLLLGFLESCIPIRQHSGSDYNNVLQGFSKHI